MSIVSVVENSPSEGTVSRIWEGEEVSCFTTARTDVCVIDTAEFGRVLFMDDQLQSTAADERMYHESLVSPAMALGHGQNKRVLILGGGEGCVAREVLGWSEAREVVQVDWDAEFVEWAKKNMNEWNERSYSDSAFRFVHGDAREVLVRKELSGNFDVVIVDLYDPEEATIDNFIEILRHAMDYLAPGGVLSVYCGMYHTSKLQATDDIIPELLKKDGHVVPYRVHIPSFGGEALFLLVAKGALAASYFPLNPSKLTSHKPTFMDACNWGRAVAWGVDAPVSWRGGAKVLSRGFGPEDAAAVDRAALEAALVDGK